MHFAQRCRHCWKYFWNSCCGIAFSAVDTFFDVFSVLKGTPFKVHVIYGKSQKSFGAKSGEQVVCYISVIDFWARNWLKEIAL
jgi:hypothetical protein